jgi:hypothetical protein
MAYTFGIELEFMGGTQRAVVDALARRGIAAQADRYLGDASRGNAWLIKPDGSCEWEAVSPVLTMAQVMEQVPVVSQAIRDVGGDARSSACGFHIHMAGFAHDVKATRNIVRRYINFEDTLDLLQPIARRGNNAQYCQSNALLFGSTPAEQTETVWGKAMRADSLDALRNLFCPNGSRYFKVNLQSLTRHGTVEMRHFAGTLDADTITAWVAFMDAFARTGEQQERLWKRPAGKMETQAERFRKMTRNVPAWAAKRLRLRAARVNGVDPFA